ncbi:MAG: CBS domain-containing protein [Nanoarchaeota archaeon]|nr:CBS domain-containing protein [Nanoarchaeota archaeon]
MKLKQLELKKAIFCEKNNDIVSVAKKLKKEKQRHIIVVDSKKPIGLISTTDINNRLVAENKDPKKTKAIDIMTSPILIKDIEDSVVETYTDLVKSNTYSCPVTEKGNLKGTIELRDIINHLAKIQLNKK